ncbi:MAG: hypothetical protein mread185_000425 [Mycoplasmataceae bacterium]|nr:MAG: hypothetical protein mread185_000425 [Mycoplasmataceae bacterium]
MKFPKKTNLSIQKKRQKDKKSSFNIFGIFLLIAFFPALISTFILKSLGIKTFFWSERGGFHHRWVKGYIAVFMGIWVYLSFVFITFYFSFFLIKMALQNKNKNLRRKTSKHLLFFLLNQLLLNVLLFLLLKNRTEKNFIISLLLIISNGFFIHYFFSKPTVKLLIEEYPHRFSKLSHQETKLIMKVNGMKFIKKTNNDEWATMITLSLVNFWILSQLLYL